MNAKLFCILFVTASIITHVSWGRQPVSYERFQGQEIAMSVDMVLKNVRFHTYNSTYRAGFSSTVETSSPETFMSAFYSAQGNEVTRLLSRESSYLKEDRKRRITADTTTNYYGLKQKITFEHNNQTVAIISYAEWINGKPESTQTITLIENGTRWQGVDPISSYDDLYLLMQRVKPEVASQLISGQKTNIPLVDSLIAQTRYRRNDLNFSKLATVIRNWQANNEKEKLMLVGGK